MKRVYIIHGWAGNPGESWFPWLTKELEKRGFEVHVPELPEAENPRIENWVPAIAKTVGLPDSETYFIGHSMGNQAVARYLETLPPEVKIGGIVFVAGFFKSLTGLTEAEMETKDHWLNAPIDFVKIKSHFDTSVAIFSDDDEFVPLENTEEFEKFFNSEIVIEKNKGHLNGEANVFELPSVLDAVLRVSNSN